MIEAEPGGVEELAAEGGGGGAVGGVLNVGSATLPVHLVGDDGVTEVGAVDADLVGAAGSDLDVEEGELGPAGTRYLPFNPLAPLLGAAALGVVAGWLVGRR